MCRVAPLQAGAHPGGGLFVCPAEVVVVVLVMVVVVVVTSTVGSEKQLQQRMLPDIDIAALRRRTQQRISTPVYELQSRGLCNVHQLLPQEAPPLLPICLVQRNLSSTAALPTFAV